MTKQEFLQRMEVMQGQGFEIFKAMFNELDFSEEKTEKISIGSDTFKDLVSTIAEEVGGDATDMIDDYELEMYSNEVSISDLTLSTRKLEQIIEDVLERYFETKD
jgi:hypothetical protein